MQHLSRTRVTLAELDSLFQKLSCKGCSHQSDRDFPRMSFPFGFSNISKVTGDEKEGVLIVMILLMETASGKASFAKAGLSGILLQQWITLFQKVLWYNCWMSKDEYACHTLASAKAEVRALLLDFKLVLDRTDGYGMKIQKYHQQIHGPANIDYFGSPKKC